MSSSEETPSCFPLSPHIIPRSNVCSARARKSLFAIGGGFSVLFRSVDLCAHTHPDRPERQQHVGHHPHDRGAVDEARGRQVRHDEGRYSCTLELEPPLRCVLGSLVLGYDGVVPALRSSILVQYCNDAIVLGSRSGEECHALCSVLRECIMKHQHECTGVLLTERSAALPIGWTRLRQWPYGRCLGQADRLADFPRKTLLKWMGKMRPCNGMHAICKSTAGSFTAPGVVPA